MGRDIQAVKISGEDRRIYGDKLRRSLDALTRMLREGTFAAGPSQVGLEIELNLVGGQMAPSMRNAQVLDALTDPAWGTELGQFNLEVNVPPRQLSGNALAELEQQIRASLNAADQKARGVGSRLVIIGILPTLGEQHMSQSTLSANERYRALNEQIFAARGEDMRIQIDGAEQLLTYADSITPEAACTSVQLHVQVSPDDFARYWNAAEAVAGAQVAVAANSPFLFGRQLWHETRITLFQQATDTRPEQLQRQGVRPRVWFGERWITSVLDLFEENVEFFPALLPICDDEDPITTLERGAIPQLGEMSLHNGTIYRWNRPVYAAVDGRPHLRVENRVLPAGPTVADILANAAFYYGLVRALAEAEDPIWAQMPFETAAENLREAARHGMDARLFWPGVGEVPAAELVVRHLLPMAREGLRRWDVSQNSADRLLGIIEQRCLTGQTGAAWQIDTVATLTRRGADRQQALSRMTERYIEHMHANEPVHTWPVSPLPATRVRERSRRQVQSLPEDPHRLPAYLLADALWRPGQAEQDGSTQLVRPGGGPYRAGLLAVLRVRAADSRDGDSDVRLE
jgi:gamma-glutamyl:cysteine ligase YbdK (ATP-grasp superfamily)